MKTYLDCIPCFFRQALDAARLAGVGEKTQKKILDEVCGIIPTLKMTASPPEIARKIYKLLAEITGNKDPFKIIKIKSNKKALALYPQMKKVVERSKDRLLAALELAVAGNIIDYGVKNHLDVEKEIKKLFNQEAETIKQEKKGIFEYQAFKKALAKASRILYLADNAGEVVFDRILLKELIRLGKNDIIYVVKESPVINDALAEDAVFCGIGGYAEIMSSGCDAPGTVLKYCSPAFLKRLKTSDLIISKGQGNFEALSGEKLPVFFLFRAKCPVVAGHIGGKLGDIVLKRSDSYEIHS
ncbi:MAG: DUF89 family protein [Candidatus Margulisbacteria bacterium]|nr:DUF89 family protein [Candidatus Margulisiibacteriota bacterium]